MQAQWAGRRNGEWRTIWLAERNEEKYLDETASISKVMEMSGRSFRWLKTKKKEMKLANVYCSEMNSQEEKEIISVGLKAAAS